MLIVKNMQILLCLIFINWYLPQPKTPISEKNPAEIPIIKLSNAYTIKEITFFL